LKKLIIAVLLAIALFMVIGKLNLDVPTAHPFSTQDDSNISSEVLSGSDSDGFSNQFEENVAYYDPEIPNDRFIILYRAWKKTDNFGDAVNEEVNWWLTNAKIPAENIIILNKENATGYNLQAAIETVATKAKENDIVFISLQGHGGKTRITTYYCKEEDPNWPSNPGVIYYTDIDHWLDEISAKVVVVQIMACGVEAAVPVLKEGPCPRVLFVYSSREFIGALGLDPEYATTADTKYGNGDGYVSLGEIGNWLDNDPRWGPDWGEIATGKIPYEDGRNFVEAEGYSKMSDPSNIAYEIYLTDYKIPG